MKKYIALIGAVIIVMGIAYVFLYKNKTLLPPKTTYTLAPEDSITIAMKEDEYSPSEITIKKGQTVTFVNESGQWRWPASNLHPTHEIFPEFDPKEPVASGSSWSFRFDKAGSWRMHDHLAPYITGTITVTP